MSLSNGPGRVSAFRVDFRRAGVGLRFLAPPEDLLGFRRPRLGGLSSASLSGTIVFVTPFVDFLLGVGFTSKSIISPFSSSRRSASTVTLMRHGLALPGVSIVIDLLGDDRKSLSLSKLSCRLIDPPDRCDIGVLLRALIGVVNFGKVCEDSVRGSGDDIELPSTHSLAFGDF